MMSGDAAIDAYAVEVIAARTGRAYIALQTLAGDRVLLCDPLTGLVAYPSFEDHLTASLPAVAPDGLCLAIGDVDDLKEYVSRVSVDDPTMFGHLAGNACMREIGERTQAWEHRTLGGWPFHVSATFGGDEVIVVAAGAEPDEFVAGVRDLADELRTAAPRPCSFAIGTLARCDVRPGEEPSLYRHFVSKVDAALFTLKRDLRANGMSPFGDIVDIGIVTCDGLEPLGWTLR